MGAFDRVPQCTDEVQKRSYMGLCGWTQHKRRMRAHAPFVLVLVVLGALGASSQTGQFWTTRGAGGWCRGGCRGCGRRCRWVARCQ